MSELGEDFRRAVLALCKRRWVVEFRPSDLENGWTGREPGYTPWTVTVVTYEDNEYHVELPEEKWLRYGAFDIEQGVIWAARDVTDRETPSE